MTTRSEVTVRLYKHPDTRAWAGHHYVEAHGWDYQVGDTVVIDGGAGY